jgi:cyclase
MDRKSIIVTTASILLFTSFSFSQDDLPQIKVTRLHTHLYKMAIGSVNAVASVGPDGVLLSDTGFEETAEAVKAELNKLGSDDIKIVINTHWHSDHVGGNMLFGKEATIIAHRNVRRLLSEDQNLPYWQETYEALPEYARPRITFTQGLTVFFNGEEIEITHFPGGHTDDDAIVYFKNANVVHLGDLLFSDGFPAVDFENGGNVEQFASNLKQIAGMLPSDVKIIAGHGGDYTIKQLGIYADMLLSTLEIIRNEMQKGTSLEDMKASKILRDWETWGKTHFSCDQWIDIVFHSLQ